MRHYARYIILVFSFLLSRAYYSVELYKYNSDKCYFDTAVRGVFDLTFITWHPKGRGYRVGVLTPVLFLPGTFFF